MEKTQNLVIFSVCTDLFRNCSHIPQSVGASTPMGKLRGNFSHNRNIRRGTTAGTILQGLGILEVPLCFWALSSSRNRDFFVSGRLKNAHVWRHEMLLWTIVIDFGSYHRQQHRS
jgi:hypothetical protein